MSELKRFQSHFQPQPPSPRKLKYAYPLLPPTPGPQSSNLPAPTAASIPEIYSISGESGVTILDIGEASEQERVRLGPISMIPTLV